MLPVDEIIKLYTLYGFEIGPKTDTHLVFFSKNGYFQNAEIVIVHDSFDEESIDKSEYENIGYSVRVKKFKTLDEIHDSLFAGFFNTTISNKKLQSEYNSFCSQQNEKLANYKYEYINGEYAEGSLIHSNVIERIEELFDSDDKQLVILEASAGYGKTCTSFEVIKNLIDSFPSKIPLMTELSKNRKANIFRYVLLSEIDQKFPSLSSELVTYEIYEGRIFLIIDGFDELLSKSYLTLHEKTQDTSRDTQTMLDTIAQLFPEKSKTKILLTTRKSSIFVGEDFDNWVDEHLDECNITRLQLSAPSLRDWIGPEKIGILSKNGIDTQIILNPVLLTILRHESPENIAKTYTSNDKIIGQYLDLLLKREQTRQSLTLTPDEQLSIMSKLAALMVQYDISVEDIDFIKSLLSDIVSADFETYEKRYEFLPDTSENKPSKSEFLDKLSHHALLDRVSHLHNQIGFLNDFIFGLMIARAVINGDLNPPELTGKYLDLAITSYSAYGIDVRKEFYSIISTALGKETAQRRLYASMSLLNSIEESYESEYFDGVNFGRSINLNSPVQFNNCYFSDCIFGCCKINTDTFKACQFINCSFYDNTFEQGETLNCELIFVSCSGHEVFASFACRDLQYEDDNVDFERVVLEQFWKPGYETFAPRRRHTTLLKGVASSDKMAMANALESLVKKGLLVDNPRYVGLNMDRLAEIRELLHR